MAKWVGITALKGAELVNILSTAVAERGPKLRPAFPPLGTGSLVAAQRTSRYRSPALALVDTEVLPPPDGLTVSRKRREERAREMYEKARTA